MMTQQVSTCHGDFAREQTATVTAIRPHHAEVRSHPRFDRSNVEAVILAAGRGSRLGGAIDNVPKCLAEVAGTSLVEHQLSILRSAGIHRICVVTGYKAAAVREAVGDRAEFVHNERWAKTNSLYSLSLCRDKLRGPVVVMNCDVLLNAAVLERLLECSYSAFAYDSSSGSDAEHMKVELADDYLTAMNKQLPGHRIQGENVGILYFRKWALRLLFREAEALLQEGGRTMWLAAAVERLVRWIPLRGVNIAGLPWIEIDFPEDLAAARQKFASLMMPHGIDEMRSCA